MRKSIANPSPAAYIGVDPSISNTGVCVLSENGTLLFCSDCGQGRKKKDDNDIERYVAQANYLASCLKTFSACAIAWENYSFDSIHRGYSLAECNGIMKAAVYGLFALPLLYVAPTTLKRFATGNGHAGKKPIMAQARAECFGLNEKTSSDICDAFFLAKYAFYRENPQKAIMLDKGNPFLRLRLEIIRQREAG